MIVFKGKARMKVWELIKALGNYPASHNIQRYLENGDFINGLQLVILDNDGEKSGGIEL